MAPSFAALNQANHPLLNAIFCGEDCLRSTVCADRNDIRIGKFAIVVRCAFWGISTPFLRLVTHIIGVGAKPKMGRVDAQRSVARVEDMTPFVYGAVVNNPASNVRSYLRASEVELSITSAALRGRPNPTRVGEHNFVEKSCNIRSIHGALLMRDDRAASQLQLAAVCTLT